MHLLNDPDFIELKQKLVQPNIFLFLGNAGYEIRHSNFLKWLLDPLESHGHADFVLKHLIDQLGIKVPNGPSHVDIKREQDNIDLLIVFEKIVIAIENKTKTKDSGGQLLRYRQTVEIKYPNHEKYFVYWTISGERPQDSQEVEHWKLYSYQEFASVLEKLCEHSPSIKAKFYIEDYLDALKLTILPKNNYVEKAKVVIKNHREELASLFSGRAAIDAADAKAISFLERHSGYVKGNGFFGQDKPFRAVFEKECRERRFRVCPHGAKQSTFFAFWPQSILDLYFPKADSGSVPFEFRFRYFDQKRALELVFQLTPATAENFRAREFIVSNVALFHENSTDSPVKGRGENHFGILKKIIPFNTMSFDAHKAEGVVQKIFDDEVKKFVAATSKVLRILFERKLNVLHKN